ncbi:VIT domain-containing protein [Slackia heliotrinireducens]|uniref:VIT domain-containing protein n=1 Tax=Slackia heliotrinireducens TaxID=84110 RepID=UPI0033159019
MFEFIRHFTRSHVQTYPTLVHWLDTTPVQSKDKPCRLAELNLVAHVSGLYAQVTQTLVIANPNNRSLSVSVTVPMPDRAVVCGYALDIDGQLIDGVVVPKEKARVAFETEQRRGADPGLVESVKGNVYQTRVYPVPGHGSRTVRLTYVAPLLLTEANGAVLDLPMPQEHLAKRTIRIDVERLDCPAPAVTGIDGPQFTDLGTCWSIASEETDVTAAAPVRVALPELPASFVLTQRDDDGTVWFSASEQASRVKTKPVPDITSLTVLWDVSGSRAAMDHAAELELLRSYCSGASIRTMRLIPFGDGVEPPCTCSNADELVRKVGALRYDGATDFRALKDFLTELVDAGNVEPNEAFILFTDGMDTLSGKAATFPDPLAIIAVVSGSQRDTESLRQACKGRVFDLANAPKDACDLARMLFCPETLSAVRGEGFADVVGIGSGVDGRFAVIGRLTGQTAAATFENTGTTFKVSADDARPGRTIARAWAAQRVAQLSTHADDNADELLALGRRHGVVSPSTSLLVLETLDQWLRYDIEPPSTWASMHRKWTDAQSGRMNLSSEAERKAVHLRNLRAQWSQLQDWYNRPMPEPETPASDARGDRRCTYCGAAISDNARFCPQCGTHVDMPAYASPADSLPTVGQSWLDTGSMAPLSEGLPNMSGSRPRMNMRMASAPVFSGAPMMAMADAAERDRSFDAAFGAAPDEASATTPTGPRVQVQPWMPNAPYLGALDAAHAHGALAAIDAYFELRREYAASPSFFIDCAGWFMAHDAKDFGIRVLKNLAELRIEDAGLLRVLAWRLREAGDPEQALVILKRVQSLRPEDSQSHRDVALVLDELARKAYACRNEDASRAYAEEAAAIYRKIALTPWDRRPMAIGLFAVEEYNVLRAWAEAQTWSVAPRLEPIAAGLEGVLACDLRVTLAWDADETDIDLHVTEPCGEEAYYGNRLTYHGGRVSEDITDGYGPEVYEIRKAEDGVYTVRAHYYASHQQTVFGPATCTLTVYTDWGRPNQKQQVVSTRLENERQMILVGTASYNGEDLDAHNEPTDTSPNSPAMKGADASVLIQAYGNPDEGGTCADGQWVWHLAGGRTRIALVRDGKVERVVESMSWGEEMIIVQ